MSASPRLDRLLTLEDPMRVADGAGGFTESWISLGRLWARITPRSGRETGERSVQDYRILVRAAPFGAVARPRPHQRFRDGERLYHIETVTEAPNEDRFLICSAFEEIAT